MPVEMYREEHPDDPILLELSEETEDEPRHEQPIEAPNAQAENKAGEAQDGETDEQDSNQV
jgi:hypothetical protein